MIKEDEIREVSKDTFVETFIEVLQSKGIDWIKEQGLTVLAETGLDIGLSIIPALGNALTTYKTNRAIKNLEIQIQLLSEKTDTIQDNLNIMSVDVKKELDKLFLYMLEKTVNEKQEEKIKYFTNAFVNLTSYSEIDVDISYIYFDTLEQLTYLDILVLVEISKGQFYYYFNPDEKPIESINYTQIQALKSNLNRLGLAENEFNNLLKTDIENSNNIISEIRLSVIELQDYLLGKKKKIKSISNKSKSKVRDIKAKEKIKISKFGKDMINFFNSQET